MAADREVNFVGSKRDVYNYAHEAEAGKSILELKTEIEPIENADFYILFFGEKDVNLELFEVKEAYEAVIDNMLEKQLAKKIILISLPPYLNQTSSIKRLAYNQELKQLADLNPKVLYLDAEQLFEANIDKYYRIEGSELSKAGYEKLAKETEKMLK